MSVILDSSDMDALTSERSEKPPTSHSNQPDSLRRVVCGVEEEHQSEPPWAGPKVFLFPQLRLLGASLCLTPEGCLGR